MSSTDAASKGRTRLKEQAIYLADQLRRDWEHLRRAQTLGLIGTSEADLLTGAHQWSTEYFRILDLDPETTTPGTAAFVDAVHPDDRSKLLPFDTLLKKRDPIQLTEIRIQRRDGEVRWLQRQIEVARDADGKPVRVLFAIQDITDRKQLEDALVRSQEDLRRSREHLVQAQRVALMGSAEFHLGTGCVFWSEGLFRILDLDPTAVPAADLLLSAIHPEDRDAVLAIRRQILSGMVPAPLTYRIVRKDGQVRWIRHIAEHVGDDRGPSARIVSSMIDVTEAREAEEERARLREHLAHTQKLDSLGALTGGIAHDFNNLLTAILGNAALLHNDEALPAEARAVAASIVGAAQRGAEFTRRLLSFGRRQMLSPVVIDLTAAARDLTALLHRTLGRHIAIDMQSPADLWNVRVDKGLLEAAIINLAVNARDAMPGGGTLTIEMSNHVMRDNGEAQQMNVRLGDYVAITVRDTGTGMSSEVLARAFEPFFTTKRDGQGTGLGLAMVYGFAKQSGGYAKIESEPGKGTSVTFYLPRSPAGKEAAASRAERRRDVAGGSERILAVDDDEFVRQFMAAALGRLGYAVTAVPDARAALEVLQNPGKMIDLLLTDLTLPGGMSGKEMAAEAARLRPGLPVLFASGYSEDTLIGNGQLERGQLLVTKPFNGDDLARRVRAALAVSAASPECPPCAASSSSAPRR